MHILHIPMMDQDLSAVHPHMSHYQFLLQSCCLHPGFHLHPDLRLRSGFHRYPYFRLYPGFRLHPGFHRYPGFPLHPVRPRIFVNPPPSVIPHHLPVCSHQPVFLRSGCFNLLSVFPALLFFRMSAYPCFQTQ